MISVLSFFEFPEGMDLANINLLSSAAVSAEPENDAYYVR